MRFLQKDGEIQLMIKESYAFSLLPSIGEKKISEAPTSACVVWKSVAQNKFQNQKYQTWLNLYDVSILTGDTPCSFTVKKYTPTSIASTFRLFLLDGLAGKHIMPNLKSWNLHGMKSFKVIETPVVSFPEPFSSPDFSPMTWLNRVLWFSSVVLLALGCAVSFVLLSENASAGNKNGQQRRKLRFLFPESPLYNGYSNTIV